ncbi:hypothetical protein [Streptomyces sp. cg40]|uniref:hypothetical protein n=1 Tax=Streptomyces sp. cg40 TaxID=3419764 RepID=UPI003D04976B
MRGRFATLIGIVVAVLALNAIGVAPASAATIPLKSVKGFSTPPVFSSENKQAQAFCQDGLRVVGGGAQVSGSNHVVIVEARPFVNAGQDSYLVTAIEDQTHPTEQWAVSAFVLCAPQPPGWEIPPGVNGNPTSNAVGSLTSPCPAGKAVTGSGGLVQGVTASTNGEVDLGLIPTTTGFATSSTVIAKEDADGFTGQYQLFSSVVCATVNFSPVDNLSDLVVATGSVTGTGPQHVSVTCPSGYGVTGVNGFSSAPGTHVISFKPTTNDAPTAAEVAAVSGIGSTWTLTAYAYCAR